MMELFRNKKQIILMILIFLFAISLIYRMTHPYRQSRVGSLTYSGGESSGPDNRAIRKDTGASLQEGALVKLDIFVNPPAHSRELKRDIFSEKGEIDEADPATGQYPTPQVSPDNTAPADNGGNVEDDLSGFRSFGYMERGEERILFLEKGKQIYLIRKGDLIDGKYRVNDITKKELALTVISNNERVHIDLSDL